MRRTIAAVVTAWLLGVAWACPRVVVAGHGDVEGLGCQAGHGDMELVRGRWAGHGDLEGGLNA
jgi:hypothetical protein